MKRKVYIIFGAGKAGMDLIQVFPAPISYIVDNDHNKWGTYHNGILICSPKELLLEEKKGLRILIASMYFPQIEDQLKTMGFENHQHYWNIIPYYGLLDKQTLVDAIEAEADVTVEKLNSSSYIERMRMIFKMQSAMVNQQQDMRVLIAVNAEDMTTDWVCNIIEGLKNYFKLDVMVYAEELPASVREIEDFICYYKRLGYSKRLYLGRNNDKTNFLQKYFECVASSNIVLHLGDSKKWLDQMYEITSKLGFNFKKISVVVPNYNYENYICRRLRSIIGQQYPIYEILFLDDASVDDSVKLAKGLLKEHHGLTNFVVNEVNSGSVFKQWIKGIELSQGDYIWIAEADDFASPLMLAQLMRSFTEDEQVVLSYCDSMFVDAMNEWQGFYSDAHVQYAHDSEIKGLFDGIYDGRFFIEQYLKTRNSIPNVSAVVMKKSAIRAEFLDRLLVFKSCGDWYFYITVLMEGKVACNTMPMNFFNRHSGVITLNANKYEYTKEVNIISKTLQMALNN
jgi:glycosyltransferase involved in cell wall biosynthesis